MGGWGGHVFGGGGAVVLVVVFGGEWREREAVVSLVLVRGSVYLAIG